MKIYKVLITGSRDWKDYGAVIKQMGIALADAKEKGYQKVVFMDGDCPTGADAMCKEFANKVEYSVPGIIIERKGYAAKWHKNDRAAGLIRNKEMVDAGPDICLAFLGPCTSPRCTRPGKHSSHGASNCAKLAEVARIPVIYTRS
jgi:hypothetical protein